MDNKDFIGRLLACCTGYTNDGIIHAVAFLTDCMAQALQEGKAVLLHGFGMFEVRKEMEYVSVNPLTRQRILNPPCLRLCFVPYEALEKERRTKSADNCLTEQDLIANLAKETELANASVFVEAFFTLIKKTVADEKYVKIKGLGTFKKMELEGNPCDEDLFYGKTVCCGISFVPDASLRDAINKPFSHFEPVILKDNVVFADLEEIPAVTFGKEKDEKTDEHEEESVGTDKCRLAETEIQSSVRQIEAENDEGDCHGKPLLRVMRMPWCMLACALLVGIIIGAGIIWGFVSDYQNVPKTVVQYKDMRTEPICTDDTVKKVPVPQVLKDVSEKLPAKIVSVAEKKAGVSATGKKVLADTVRYEMLGTLRRHTLRNGESLTKLALKYYGNKKLWPYLVRYNQKTIKNPDNIPIGTVIQIPILAPKEEKE